MKNCVPLILICLVIQSCTTQSRFERLMYTYDVPDPVVEKLKFELPNDDLDKAIETVSINNNGRIPRYRFYLKQNKSKTGLTYIAIQEDGKVANLKVYRYEKNGDIPLEMVMNMQEKCGDDKVRFMAKVEYPALTMYQAKCGEVTYKFDDAFMEVNDEVEFATTTQ